MLNLSSFLNLQKNDIISITGSGGKTTLLKLLSLENINQKVLMTTTTKIYNTDIDKNYFNIILGDKNSLGHLPKKGVNVLVNLDKENKKKFSSLDLKTLKQVVKNYDLVFIEADGSKNKPLKWWNEKEPVVIEETTKTIGIVNLDLIDKNLNDENFHRLESYIKDKNFHPNNKFTTENLKELILDKKGLFKNYSGEKILLINRLDTPEQIFRGKKFVDFLLKNNKDSFKFDKIILASLKNRIFISP